MCGCRIVTCLVCQARKHKTRARVCVTVSIFTKKTNSHTCIEIWMNSGSKRKLFKMRFITKRSLSSLPTQRAITSRRFTVPTHTAFILFLVAMLSTHLIVGWLSQDKHEMKWYYLLTKWSEKRRQIKNDEQNRMA